MNQLLSNRSTIMAEEDLTDKQRDGLNLAREWLHYGHDQKVFKIFGHAGTGKTTLIRHLAKNLNGSVCFAAFSGKATLNLKRAGCVNASTIHSMIYSIRQKKDGSIDYVLNHEDSPAADCEAIFLDEVSMVDEQLAKDLLSFGKPIIVLGDDAQLPPIKGKGYFLNGRPDVLLTEVHRQAQDNPIIKLATMVRNGEKLQECDLGRARVVRRGVLGLKEILAADQIICGRNVTRNAFNRKIRKGLGREGLFPAKHDRLICLRNDSNLGIFNGGMFEVVKCETNPDNSSLLDMTLISEDFPRKAGTKVSVRREFFEGGAEDLDWRVLRGSQQMDYGFAITTHKAQGSQWESVVLYDESEISFPDQNKWLYTGITRAQSNLTVVID